MRLDSTNTFLTIVCMAMFSVTTVLVSLLVCVPGQAEAYQCDPALTAVQCPDGLTCNEFGYCVTADPVVDEPHERCQIGQRADSCDCPAGLEVRDELCVEPVSKDICEHSEVAALLERLDRACASEHPTAPGRLETCPEPALRDVVLGSHRDTLKIARAFREQSFTLHFNHGTPAERAANRWPGAGQGKMVQVVANRLEGVDARGYLLLVALASSTGKHAINYKLAARRSDAAVNLIGRARREFPRLDASLGDLQLLVGLVGYEQQATLDLETFDEIWGESGRFHGWDRPSTERMKADLAALRDGSITPGEREWLTRVVNQSVLVVPLPCQAPSRKAEG